ncbi:unnamed protein product [Caenorhabditis bovis]|uniref:Metalloendopeptidase n=1 Tax=Caenorhabditis bovis TaxID=2654633 RepID=A0A8S1FDT7_9PELO|nr:unnamed protein product [Caenorhabditis bovis]
MLKELAVSLLLVTTVVSYSVRSEGVEHHRRGRPENEQVEKGIDEFQENDELLPLNLLNNDDPIEDEESISHPIILNDEILNEVVGKDEFDLFEINKNSNLHEHLIEGDILVKENENSRRKRQITKAEAAWPNQTAFYEIYNITQKQLDTFNKAFKFIGDKTCVKFVEKPSAPHRIVILNGQGCYSYFGSAVHELMHALGIEHTMSRYDRNNYVKIDPQRFSGAGAYNYRITTPKETFNAVPYEYQSALHYSHGYGAITALDEEYAYGMGNRMVTFYDIQNINDAYRCFCAKSNTKCAHGGYWNPNGCSTCLCPEGYGGDYCDELAPEDTTIQVDVVYVDNLGCQYGCNINGIEIKYLADPRISNPKRCCVKQFPKNPIESKLNPTPIILYSRKSTQMATIKYRYVDTPSVGTETKKNGYDSYEYRF